ncbi:MAG: response regulator transcription factor [Gammaproteobacteria bacterium]|nr:response regulator transcription factor [Gammaproteobacteria bacterium]NNC78172.1 response regulator transcription factor [Woeseiaceae bacterium]
MKQNIRTLLIDGHEVARISIINILRDNSDITIIGETGDGLEAIQIAVSAQPDIAILDMGITDPPALDVLECITQMSPSCKVLALTMHDDDEYLMPVINAGASGYLLKDSAGKELLRAVDLLASGRVYFGQHAARILADRLKNQ